MAASLRHISVPAIGLPVAAGIAFMAARGAPPSYWAVNAAALGLAVLILLSPKRVPAPRPAAILVAACIAAIALPILVGPESGGARRWLPLGPLTLHAANLLAPAAIALAWKAGDKAALALVAALGAIAFVQPDAALAAGLAGAALAGFLVVRNAVTGAALLVAVAALLLTIFLRPAGPPPVDHVEAVVQVALALSLPLGLALLAAQLMPLALFRAGRPGLSAAAGYAGGCAIAALAGPYPSVLIGYGASPILGIALGFAIALSGRAGEKAA